MALEKLGDDCTVKLEQYQQLLIKWNNAYNLVAKNTIEDAWNRHFMDSAQLVEYLPTDKVDILDIGSGAGFPSLVIAILTNHNVTAVESNSKKCMFMKHIAQELNLDNVTIKDSRIENLEPQNADIITARACASVTELLDYGMPHLKENGQFLLLKGAKANDEIAKAKNWQFKSKLFPNKIQPEAGGYIVKIEGVKS